MLRATTGIRVPATTPGPRSDQRHPQRRLVDEEPVHRFLVIAQPFAVV